MGRSDTYSTEYDLEADEFVPIPKGDVHKVTLTNFKLLVFSYSHFSLISQFLEQVSTEYVELKN